MTDLLEGLGRLPISPDSPAGTDVRGEAAFERLQGEIDKLSNPNAAGSTDWQAVQRDAVALLEGTGKDLLVACYLAHALSHTQGLAGFASGLGVIDDMIDAHWDTLFPPVARLRGRRNAVAWLAERSMAAFGPDAPAMQQPQPAALVASLQQRLQSIDGRLAERDPDAPSLRPLLSQVRSLPVEEPPPPPAAPPPMDDAPGGEASAPQPAPAAPVAPRAPSAASAPPPLAPTPALPAAGGESDADHVVEQLCARIAEVAGWLRQRDPADPRAFRLNRMAAWAGIDQAPPARGAQTALPAPIAQIADALERLQSGGASDELVQFAEAQLPAFPFWLDLNHACAEALARRGEAGAAALGDVAGETARLLQRLPTLAGLTFNDGRPFASDATQAWLATLATAGDRPEGADGAPAVASGGSAIAQARQLAADGQLEQAAAALQRMADAAGTSPPQRLKARIQLAQLLLAERPAANLAPFAQALLDDVDRHQLDTWDPPLALAALEIACRLLLQHERRDAADALLQRIARLDAATAVRLATGG